MATNITCAGCMMGIENEEYLRCYKCQECYDLLCANVPVQRFYNTEKNNNNWKCCNCRRYEPKSGNIDTPVRGLDDDSNVNCRRRGASTMVPYESSPEKHTPVLEKSGEDINMRALVSEIKAFREEMRASRLRNEEQIKEFSEFKKEMKAMRVQIADFQGSLSGLIAKVDSNEKRLNELCERVNKLEGEVGKEVVTNDESKKLLDCISLLKADLNDREQELLSNDIEISCIPEQKDENLLHIAMTLARKLGVQLAEQDVVCATRVGPAPGRVEVGPARRPRPIVVRLVRRATRDKLLQEARVRRGATTEDTGLPGLPRKFYVNERLTRSNRHLFRRARELADSLNWRFIWTRDGKIFARQHPGQGAPRHRLRTEMDLERVFGSQPVGSAGNQ